MAAALAADVAKVRCCWRRGTLNCRLRAAAARKLRAEGSRERLERRVRVESGMRSAAAVNIAAARVKCICPAPW